MSSEPLVSSLSASKGGLKSSVIIKTFEDHQTRLANLKEFKITEEKNQANISKGAEESNKRLGLHGKALTVLHRENAELKEKLEDLEERLRELERKKVAETSEEDSSEEDESVTISENECEAWVKSDEAYRSVVLKELVRLAYEHNLGVAKVQSATLPWYPEDRNKATWPRIPDSEDLVLRFRWEAGQEHEDNYYAIRMIVGWIKRHGKKYLPAAEEDLKKVSEDDLHRRVAARFVGIQKMLRRDGKLDSNNKRVNEAPTEENEGGSGGNRDEDKDERTVKLEAQKKKRNTAAILDSRAKGKLVVRERQRKNLPPDSKFRDPKYDAAFTFRLMSDDEDELDANGNKTGNFVSHAPMYRSKELIELFAAVDSVPDPERSIHYVKRIRGEPVDEPPKKSNKLENKARRWMIDPEWLEKDENVNYDAESRIVDSGKAWGDKEDPAEAAAKRAKIKAVKKELLEKRKRGSEKKKANKRSRKGDKGKKPISEKKREDNQGDDVVRFSGDDSE